jgi:hypothetical protein
MTQTNTTYERAMSERRAAIRENSTALREKFHNLFTSSNGHYALMRNGQVVDIYATQINALDDGRKLYPTDFNYSVEHLESEPYYIGIYADHVITSEN